MVLKTSLILFMAAISCGMAAPMTKARLMELMEFVNTIPLAEPKLPPGFNHSASIMVADTTDHQKQGFVDSGSLVSFTDKVMGQQKDDVLNAALFSQLAAEYKYNRETQTDDWYKYYTNVLENIGWVMQDFTFERYQNSGGKFTMDAVVIDILAAIATDDELAVAQEVLAALKSMSDKDGRIVLFEHNSFNDQAGSFQIIPCSQDDSGQVVMGLAGFHFQEKESQTRFLFFEWDSASIDIYKSTQVVTLDQDVYTNVRSTIVSRLGDKAKQFVANIPLA